MGNILSMSSPTVGVFSVTSDTLPNECWVETGKFLHETHWVELSRVDRNFSEWVVGLYHEKKNPIMFKLNEVNSARYLEDLKFQYIVNSKLCKNRPEKHLGLSYADSSSLLDSPENLKLISNCGALILRSDLINDPSKSLEPLDLSQHHNESSELTLNGDNMGNTLWYLYFIGEGRHILERKELIFAPHALFSKVTLLQFPKPKFKLPNCVELCISDFGREPCQPLLDFQSVDSLESLTVSVSDMTYQWAAQGIPSDKLKHISFTVPSSSFFRLKRWTVKDVFFSKSKLESLHLDICEFDFDDLVSTGNHDTLKSLKLCNVNVLTNIEMISEFSNLEVLDCFTTYRPFTADEFPRLFTPLTHLKVLKFHGNEYEDSEHTLDASQLPETLEVLHICNYGIDISNMGHLKSLKALQVVGSYCPQGICDIRHLESLEVRLLKSHPFSFLNFDFDFDWIISHKETLTSLILLNLPCHNSDKLCMFTKLKKLDLAYMHETTIDLSTGLENVEELSIKGKGFRNISNLPHLKSVNMDIPLGIKFVELIHSSGLMKFNTKINRVTYNLENHFEHLSPRERVRLLIYHLCALRLLSENPVNGSIEELEAVLEYISRPDMIPLFPPSRDPGLVSSFLSNAQLFLFKQNCRRVLYLLKKN